MKITSDLLLNYGAPDSYINYFEQFKDGIEVDDLNIQDIPIDILYFIIKYWKLPAAQYEQYLNRCQIVNSKNIYHSIDIADSSHVIDSQHVSESEWVQNSKNIETSSNIYDCSNIVNSHDIWKSDKISNSNTIIASTNTDNSSEIIYSSEINWSNIINCSYYISESTAIYRSSNVLNSQFCGFCKRISNSLFCINQTDKNYQLFNAPVQPAVFERIQEELLARLQTETFNFIQIDDSGYYPQERYFTTIRFDSMFKNLSPEFYGWVGTLPNYSEEVFLSLFFK